MMRVIENFEESWADVNNIIVGGGVGLKRYITLNHFQMLPELGSC